MKICKIKVNQGLLLLYIIVLLAVICSGSPLAALYYSNLIIVFLVVALFEYLYLRRKKYKVNKDQLVYVGILIVALYLTMGVNVDNNLSHYIGKTISLLTLLLVASIIPYDKFCEVYVKIIALICVYSLFFTMLFDLVPSFAEKLPRIYIENAGTWSHYKYIYYIWGGYSSIWTTLIRNSGFFREPGVFSTHICMAMILVLAGKIRFKSVKSKKILMVLLFITGLSTFSTVGVIGSVICFIVYLRSDSIKISKYLYLAIVTIVAGYFLINNQEVLFSKFNSAGANFVSVTDRTNGLMSAITVWLQNPILGKGYSYFQSHKVGVSTFFLFDLGGKYGLIYAFTICSGILLFIKSLSNNRVQCILYLGIYSLFLISQGLVELPVFMLLQLYGVQQYRKKEKEGE